MLITMLEKKERVMHIEHKVDWEEAIASSSQPLLDEGSVEKKYIQKMINNVKEFGPYIIIAPQIALAHARPEDGVNKTDLSLLISKTPILFSEDKEHEVFLLFTLAAQDSNNHLHLLSELSVFLSEPDNINALIETTNKDDVLSLFKNYLGGIK